MSDKRIRFYSEFGNMIGFAGIEKVSNKYHIQFELFDAGLRDEDSPSFDFVIHLERWKEIVKFIEDELMELGG